VKKKKQTFPPKQYRWAMLFRMVRRTSTTKTPSSML